MNLILKKMLGVYPQLQGLPIEEAYEILLQTVRSRGVIYTCGNGGSASDSEHIVGELMKGFLLKRPLPDEEKEAFSPFGEDGRFVAERLQRGIPAVSLNSQTSLLTAVGNDVSFDMIFAQQVFAYGKTCDALITMTTSGNSANAVYAAVCAKARGMRVVGITGENPGRLGRLCDVCLCMPSAETYRVQEYTLPVYHVLCAMLEREIFG